MSQYKLLALSVVSLLALSAFGCSEKQSSNETPAEHHEITQAEIEKAESLEKQLQEQYKKTPEVASLLHSLKDLDLEIKNYIKSVYLQDKPQGTDTKTSRAYLRLPGAEASCFLPPEQEIMYRAERIPYREGAPYLRDFVMKRAIGADSWLTQLKTSEEHLPLFFKVEAQANDLTVPMLVVMDAHSPSTAPVGMPSDNSSILIDFYKSGVLRNAIDPYFDEEIKCKNCIRYKGQEPGPGCICQRAAVCEMGCKEGSIVGGCNLPCPDGCMPKSDDAGPLGRPLVGQNPYTPVWGGGFTDPKRPIFSLPKLRQAHRR